jgi:hypothetical protein
MSHISPPGRRHSSRTTARRVLLADDARPQPVITVAVGGSLLRVQNAKYQAPERAGGKRGRITGFSNDSRRRLIDLMASINRQQAKRPPLFITLTYPATWPEDPAVWKGHLDTFLKRFGRRWPDAAAVWKLEFQARGAPHFHLMVFGVAFVAARWVAEAWADVVASADSRHRQAGTEVRRVRSWGGAMHYVAKYFSKATVENIPGHVGRYWGVHNREALPIELLAIPIGHGDFFRFRRVLLRFCISRFHAERDRTDRCEGRARFKPKIRSEYLGCKVYCDYPVMLQLLRSIGG